MMADAADEHEQLFGSRREGLYFAGITFSAKAASGLGLLIGGIALDLIGFPHGAAATTAVIPAATVVRLGITYGPGAALFTAVSVAVLIGFRLTQGRPCPHSRRPEEPAGKLGRFAGDDPRRHGLRDKARMTEVAELDTFVSGPQPEPAAAGAAAKPKLSFGNLAFYGAGSLVENATSPVLALSLFYLSALCGLTGSAGRVRGHADPGGGLRLRPAGRLAVRQQPLAPRPPPPVHAALAASRSSWRSACCSRCRLGLHRHGRSSSTRWSPCSRRGSGCRSSSCPTWAWGPSCRTTTPSARPSSRRACSSAVVVGLVMAVLSAGVFLGGPHGQLYRPGYTALAWTAGAIALVGGLISTARHPLVARPAPPGAGRPAHQPRQLPGRAGRGVPQLAHSGGFSSPA